MSPAAHVLVDDVEAPALDEDARHHLQRVRRLRPGTSVTVTDGRGRRRACRLVEDGLEPDGPVELVPRPDPPVTVAFALTKGDKPELVVQKLTELGVDRIIPFRAERSVVRWDEARAAHNAERWRAVARAALEQSLGCWLPEVADVADVDHLVTLGAARADRHGSPPSLARSVVAVGPEGGWSDTERERLPEAVGLGQQVLRAETAALTAGMLLCSIRSGLVRAASPSDAKAGKDR